ncbi:hypothetical protein QAD02_010456 [Eretmocerus hayati]|uniref:Uncharacterized protein n=1 Tax=Eretmocerus hayati TaxID=131215 RepID=A0ACC2NYM8_9HYME|nr:hypothetical protein QAD02_010456 [Eretmocerus hayati]
MLLWGSCNRPPLLDTSLLSPPGILLNIAELALFYLLLKGARELFFEDLDLARERYYQEEQEELDDIEDQQQHRLGPSSSSLYHCGGGAGGGHNRDNRRNSNRYCSNLDSGHHQAGPSSRY